MANWMKIRIENTPGIGADMTRIEPISEWSDIRAEWNQDWQEMGAKILQDIAEHPEKYPEELIKAVINTKHIVKK